MKPALILAVLLTILVPRPARSIQGCTLRNPDRDIRKLFPDSTDYRSSFISIQDRGGEKLHKKLQERLSDDLDPVYEAMDVPYAYYQVLNGKKTVGYVFGVNQKGRYGGMQIILATDPSGKILHLYYQKLSAPDRKAFQAEKFTDQFKGLTLADFYYHKGYEKLGLKPAKDKVAAVRPPAESDAALYDFKATLRGVMKNLILFDFFFQKDKNGDVFSKVKRIVEEKRGGEK
jgi:hypothetical protein